MEIAVHERRRKLRQLSCERMSIAFEGIPFGRREADSRERLKVLLGEEVQLPNGPFGIEAPLTPYRGRVGTNQDYPWAGFLTGAA